MTENCASTVPTSEGERGERERGGCEGKNRQAND